MKEGTPGAKDKVFRLLYAELHALAQKQLQGENPGHTLQPTALVHEAYLRLVRAEGGHFEDRRHFMRTAARAMRSILVDFARRKNAAKRGGRLAKVTLIDDVHAGDASADEVIAVNDALALLSQIDERQAKVVELRYFAGLTVEETAETMEMSVASVHRFWNMARAWLLKEMGPA